MAYEGVSACSCDPGHCDKEQGLNLPKDEYCLHEHDADRWADNGGPVPDEPVDTRKWPDDFRGFGIIVKL